MLSRLMTHVEGAYAAPTAEDASVAFFTAMQDFGASYLQTRLYRRPTSILTSTSHWAAGGFITRLAPTAWPGSAAFDYVCFECNPLLGAIRESRTSYRFSDFAPQDSVQYGAYWEALSEADIDDALCATSYGSDGAIASLHLGFHKRDFSPDEAFAIHMAGLGLTERLMSLTSPPPTAAVRLTARERDSLALVAEGKTDWEISVILGIAEATVRFHVDNARRKLGAVNRAQAVARLVNQRLI
ncbi:helix-turn-helix transcriptional regulator [Mesorhizobium sp. CU2]|uniref:helix-turn-helix transcriptional regulator n=1 Tax=unclassified Mesorhizobium TaxID=325217 RepID=UPI0011260DBE|nr:MULTISPECIES: LuxR C-terminal-related transcriptional regulator [unclassified Mesorhizobium]TPN80833.1 helix-turn-helix transcriptional regulator [Mesorhizobium sp. CU3]TPO12517.1 helix-turn-helix transcriptional regulator [Mesorhizobium sp. CU2]